MPRNICEPPSFFCSTHSLKAVLYKNPSTISFMTPRSRMKHLHARCSTPYTLLLYIRTYFLLRSSKSVCRLQIWGRSYFYRPKKILNISLCAYYLLLLPNEVCSAPSSPLLRRALLRNKLNNNSLINSDKNEKKPFP